MVPLVVLVTLSFKLVTQAVLWGLCWDPILVMVEWEAMEQGQALMQVLGLTLAEGLSEQA